MVRINCRRIAARPALPVLLLLLLFWASTNLVLAAEKSGPIALIDLNRATLEELQTLPFIGEVRARAIIAYRRQHGPFTSPEDLLGCEAVGPRTLEAIRPYLRGSGSATALPQAELASDPESAAPAEPAALDDDSPAAAAAEERDDTVALNVGRLIVTRPGQIKLLCDQDYYPVLLNFLRRAGHNIEVAMFVFRATGAKGNRPTMIVEELIAAGGRGVEVTVVLEKSSYDPGLTREHQRLARILRQGGITVHFGPKATTTHTKIILIDERFVLLGSHNLTHAALSFNHECSLLIDSDILAGQLAAYLDRLR